MRAKKLVAVLLSGMLAVSAMGCGSEVNKNAVVATFDETDVSLGVANFAARLQQATYDDFYVAYFGEQVWSTDMYGNGTTMQETTKDSVMDTLKNMYIMQAHMADYGVTLSEEESTAIADAATAFIEANEQDALDALGAEQQFVEEYLKLLTIQSKMYDAIVADADTNVSDAAANTGAYSYVSVFKTSYTDDEGNVVEYTEAELEELANTVAAFAAEVKTGTLEEAAEKYGYTVSTGTFRAQDENMNEAVLNALNGMEEGAVSDVVDTDSYYYVLRLDAKTDAEATEQTRASIINERQSALYDEVLTGWTEMHTWTVDEKVWESVTFDNLFTTVVPSTETEEATEQ